jgi:hypothetical protein
MLALLKRFMDDQSGASRSATRREIYRFSMPNRWFDPQPHGLVPPPGSHGHRISKLGKTRRAAWDSRARAFPPRATSFSDMVVLLGFGPPR